MKFYLKSACKYKFRALMIQAHTHTALPNHILYFLTTSGRSKENLSIPAVTQEYLELTLPPHSLDKYQKLKYEILDSHCIPDP